MTQSRWLKLLSLSTTLLIPACMDAADEDVGAVVGGTDIFVGRIHAGGDQQRGREREELEPAGLCHVGFLVGKTAWLAANGIAQCASTKTSVFVIYPFATYVVV